MQEKVKNKGLPWSAAKGFDTFCPIGPFLEASQIPDNANVNLWLKVGTSCKTIICTHNITRPDKRSGAPKWQHKRYDLFHSATFRARLIDHDRRRRRPAPHWYVHCCQVSTR